MRLITFQNQSIEQVLWYLNDNFADGVYPFAYVCRMQIRFDGAQKFGQIFLARCSRSHHRDNPNYYDFKAKIFCQIVNVNDIQNVFVILATDDDHKL